MSLTTALTLECFIALFCLPYAYYSSHYTAAERAEARKHLRMLQLVPGNDEDPTPPPHKVSNHH